MKGKGEQVKINAQKRLLPTMLDADVQQINLLSRYNEHSSMYVLCVATQRLCQQRTVADGKSVIKLKDEATCNAGCA